MTKATESALKMVKEMVELAKSDRAHALQMYQVDPTDRRATPRIPFLRQIRCYPKPNSPEEQVVLVQGLDVSLGGIGFSCEKALAEGTVVRIRLPLMDGKTGWVNGKVVHCRLDGEVYRVGITFLLDEE